MSSSQAIRVEGLAKSYRIGVRSATYQTLRESLMNAAGAPFRALRALAGKKGKELPDETLWALRDVSFEVAYGEVVGVIGRNGAGKSTLLKILSRITEPTRGFAEIRGRVGSLLEVGTGFHPELTGRENIFLNGAILGMNRVEIARKFDEIVAFSEVERFVDTPVKHYSTGMHMRLAFAVAAHLEPEILIVDEVLAVGDARFQRKCLDKMQDVGKKGRTVLFVSHSMNAITRLCPRVILLDAGALLRDGAAHQVVSAYLGSGLGTAAARDWDDPLRAPGNDVVRLRSVRVHTEDGTVTDAHDIRKPIGISMHWDVLRAGHVLSPNMHFVNEHGITAFVLGDCDPAWRRTPRSTGRYVSTVWIPGNMLAEGGLMVTVAVSSTNPSTVHVLEREAVAFQVIDSMDGDSARGDYAGAIPGVVRPIFKWTTQHSPAEGKA